MNAPRVTASARPSSTPREDRLTLLFSTFLIVGLFLDGYAHEELLDANESFLTPWHAVFYAGFGAAAAWTWSLAARRRRPGQSLIAALPAGYELSPIGLVVFGVGGIGDALWHGAFGVEVGIDALLSPTHLVLFTGLMLLLLAPWRAAMRRPGPESSRAGAWSIVLATALVGFFANYVWGLGIQELVRVPYNAASQAGETEVIAGIGSVLVTTAIVFGAAAILLRGGRLAPWWFAVTFGLVAALVSLAFDEGAAGVVAALGGGIVLDALTREKVARRLPTPFAFGLSAAAMWAAFFAMVGADTGVAWPPEIWSGAVALAALFAWLLGHGGQMAERQSADQVESPSARVSAPAR